MSLRHETLAVVVGLVLIGCTGGPTEPDPTVPAGEGAATPIGAVDDLVGALNAPDFVEASRLARPGQAALASLAEGATFDVVAEALREEDQEVAANFWSGFAQGTGNFLSGDVATADEGSFEEGGVEFHTITVTPPNGESRAILVTEEEGYRVDLFASFGPGLADKMMAQVERLLITQTEDARLILARLQEVVPSLLAAARLPGTPGDVSQQLLALVEVITRVS